MKIGKFLQFFGFTNSSPTNGDLWYDGTDTKVYNGGVEKKVGLPPQTGNSGKFLTTNGTNASWGVGQWIVQMLKATTGSAITSQLSNLLSKTTNNLIALADQTSVIRYDGSTITVTAHGATAGVSMALGARAGGTVAIQTSGSGTWRYSSDDGATWNNATGGTTAMAGGYMVAGNPNGGSTTWFFVTLSSGVVGWRSTDDAHTWNMVLAVYGLSNVVAAGLATDNNSNWVALASTGLVRVSTDDGVTWGAGSMGSLTTSGKVLIYVNSLFVATDAIGGGLIYYSSSATTAWTTIPSPVGGVIFGISYWNSVYIVVDISGNTFTCPDITASNPLWTKVGSLYTNPNTYTDLIYFNGKYYNIDNVGTSNIGGRLYQYTP